MASPLLLLSDIELEAVRNTFATLFSDPEPFRRQIEITRSVSAAVAAIGGASEANAPSKSQYINLVVALDSLSNGDYSLAEFMAARVGASNLSEAVQNYHELLGQSFSNLGLTQMRMFDRFPTQVLLSLIRHDKITTTLDTETKQTVCTVLQTAITRNVMFGKTSVETLIADPTYAASIESSATSKGFLRKLGRLAPLVRLPQDLKFLWDTPFDSAYAIAHTPRSSFVVILVEKGLSLDSAVAIHDHAGMIDLRNEQAWTALLASKSQWSPAVMSSTGTVSTPLGSPDSALTGELINYSNIFGDVYIDPCDDCSSVTSPSAYFVDLLRLLKHCPSNPRDARSPSLLTKLLERRPDLRDLQLTCVNTNVLIPYTDLANEVMESFITNMPAAGDVATVAIGGFDMTEADQSARNISQPQNTRFGVYKEKIGPQVFPLDIFPYNQAIDTIRSYATAFGASWHEIMTIYQSKYALSPDPGDTAGTNPVAYQSAAEVLNFARSAEYLNLQPDDFVAITQNSIYPRKYYLTQLGVDLDQTAYAAKIGLGEAHSYWGYPSHSLMMAANKGLANIAEQFMVRANMTLQEVLDLLQTRFLGGRLVIGNAADAPIFNTDITDLKLRHPTSSAPKGSLTAADCFALQAFIRLWRKSGWTLHELDLGLSCFCQQLNSAEDIPQITPETIAALAAIQEMQRLTGLQIEHLMPLWSLIDTFASPSPSLYAKLFLQGDPKKPNKLFGPDSQGHYLTDPAVKLLDNATAVAAGLGISDANFGAVLWGARIENDVLDIANMSALYRVHTFCQILQISPFDYPGFLTFFEPGFSPFSKPQETVKILREWRSCAEAGLTLPQVLYVTGATRKLRMNHAGYGMSDKAILEMVYGILAGLLEVENTLPDSSLTVVPATEVVRIANLVFDPVAAPQIVQFIEGTGIVPRSPTAPIFQDVLLPHFKSNEAEACSVLFQEPPSAGSTEELALAIEVQNNARRLVFLQSITPVLRSRLTSDLIVNCVKSIVPGHDVVLATALISDIICERPSNEPTLKILSGLLNTNSSGQDSSGMAYFRPPSTDMYRFYLPGSTEHPAPKVTLDGKALTWTATPGSWVSNETKLNNGQICTLRSQSQFFTNATFGTVRSAAVTFNSNVLVFQMTLQKAIDVLTPLLRAADFLIQFQWDIPTVQFMHDQANGAALAMDFSQITYADINMAIRFNNLRRRVATNDLDVIEYFQWVNGQVLDTSLDEKLSALCGTPATQIREYLDAKFPHFTSSALVKIFSNDHEVSQLLAAIEFSSRFGIPGIGFKSLFNWAKPVEPTEVGAYYDYAAEIRQVAQLFPLDESDNNPVTKANNILRVNQRQALATYLLQQNYIRSRKIFDFGHLFEYFLIDVQMSPCLQTSRLVQAIATVQLYTQRCILGLEKSQGVSSGTVNLDRWAWMQKYRLWEANRKVFLYPENWLEPSLRDNKSEAFLAFEADMLQTDINDEAIKRMVHDYIYSVSTVADLGIQAYSWDRRDDGNGKLHFFGRTRHAPYTYFYRSAQVSGTPAPGRSSDSFTRWTAWSKIDVEIPAIETEANGQPLPLAGSYLSPAVRDGRLFLFLPQIMLRNVAKTGSDKTIQQLSTETPANSLPEQFWHIQMAWTEYRNGKWSTKVVAPDVMTVTGARMNDAAGPAFPITTDVWKPCVRETSNTIWKSAKQMPSVSSFKFTTYTRPGSTDLEVITIVVDRWIGPFDGRYVRYPCGAFELRGEQLTLLDLESFQATPYATPFTDTVPTMFNKVTWSGSRSLTVPNYEITMKHSNTTKPFWSKIGTIQADRRRPNLTYTMSSDMTCFPSAAHGLVVEAEWPDHFQTLFNQVNITEQSVNGYEISTSEEMNNLVWPLVMNTVSTSASLGPVYDTLSKNKTASARYQLFGSENVDRNETSMPAAIYTWELGVHIVMLLVERLRDLQQFELGMRIARFVFDPTVDESDPIALDVSDETGTSKFNLVNCQGHLTQRNPNGTWNAENWAIMNRCRGPLKASNGIGTWKARRFLCPENAWNTPAGSSPHQGWVVPRENPLTRCWTFAPFKEIASRPIPTAGALVASLRASSGAESTMSPNILASRENPFNAHVIARGRPSAYMKRFVMTYIEMLVGSGDVYFR